MDAPWEIICVHPLLCLMTTTLLLPPPPTHTQELQYREFCEFLVRLAASRYRLLPNLERRVHTLVYAHLLHQVSLSLLAAVTEAWVGCMMQAVVTATFALA
jgi:hypothetical protein